MVTVIAKVLLAETDETGKLVCRLQGNG
jgi:hypothetical protein